MESTIGNACFELIQQIAQSKGKSIFVADLYAVPTSRYPTACDLLSSLPDDVYFRDAVVIPVWKPGHFLLSVLNSGQREIFFLDSKCEHAQFGFGDLEMRELLRNLCQSLSPGPWKETTGLDIEYALYKVMEAPFDFTVTDMPSLRKWWCIMLIENLDLGSHGKPFAHWTDTSKALLRGEVPPVFKLKKRRRDEIHEGSGHLEQTLQLRSSEDVPGLLEPLRMSQDCWSGSASSLSPPSPPWNYGHGTHLFC